MVRFGNKVGERIMQLLTEKYRPKTVKDLVFINEDYENKFKSWISTKNIDSHLLFY